MSLAPILSARSLILGTLKTNSAYTTYIPAARTYPAKVPASPVWPFARLDSMTAVPARNDCADDADITGRVHIFVKLDTANVPDPEAYAAQACDAASSALEALEDCHIESVQIMMDAAEADAFHGIVQFRLLGVNRP